jgi:hypothetical protein
MKLLGVHQGNSGIQHAVREAPLVVVPAGHFHQLAADFGQSGIKCAGCWVVIEVDGHQRRFVVFQHTFQWALQQQL